MHDFVPGLDQVLLLLLLPLSVPVFHLLRFMFIKYPRTLDKLDVGYRTSWVHASRVPQRGLSSPSVGFLSTEPPNVYRDFFEAW